MALGAITTQYRCQDTFFFFLVSTCLGQCERSLKSINDIDLDGLNSSLSNADWNDVFDASLFDIGVIHQRFFLYCEVQLNLSCHIRKIKVII